MPVSAVAGNVPTMKIAPYQVGSQRAWRRPAGFTLIELMIGITVAAILLGIGIPSFQDTIRRNRVTTQTNVVISALAVARSEAVKRGTPVTLCPALGRSGDDQNKCSGDDKWAANGWIVFSDVRGTLGTVDTKTGEPANTNDSIIQRLPPASDQSMNVVSARKWLTYKQDGSVDLPVGTDATFVHRTRQSASIPLAPRQCR